MMSIVNPDTGEIRQAQVFVAVLGASNYTFACASWSQNQADWLNAHVQVFEFFGGVPELVVPDNLKSAVRKTHRHEPDINPAYQQLASHYGVAVVPARPERSEALQFDCQIRACSIHVSLAGKVKVKIGLVSISRESTSQG